MYEFQLFVIITLKSMTVTVKFYVNTIFKNLIASIWVTGCNKNAIFTFVIKNGFHNVKNIIISCYKMIELNSYPVFNRVQNKIL